ncbi:hypothetical protein [Phaeodactylibacter sp.]|uniref:hypothetical protein n=1 Tax=Phaeodactylibacter sp. TaxID=1940289 RepID=UPI0025E55733|nr:hypothetical protein [Phaeodactylibacter sp.]MCI5090925.1 hypothetical protein [Phaeodactylibacter sp.]
MRRETTDRIIGISAITISLLTLIIFIYQTNIIYEQSRLSVTPRLNFKTRSVLEDSIQSLTFALINKGLGPAIINSSKIKMNGEEFSVDMDEFFDLNFPKLGDFGHLVESSSLSEGSTLTPNEEQILFTYSCELSQLPKILEYFEVKEPDEFEFPFNIEIEYSSIYEEKWTVDYDDGMPKKI